MPLHLVTGGAGFIGSHLVEALLARGDRVRVLDNLSTGRKSNLATVADRIELVEGDLTDRQAVTRAVEGVELVFHQAALASVPLSVERPLEVHAACATGTLVLLEAARGAGVKRLVYAASSAAYGDQPTAAKRESDPAQPQSPYAAAKLAAEHYCRAYTQTFGFETVSLRYFNVFGPRQDPAGPYSAVIPKFVSQMLAGRRPVIFGDGRQSRDFTYVGNVVAGNLLAAEVPAAAGRTINLADGRATTLLQLVDLLNDLLGTALEPDFQPARAGDIHQSLADITLARTLLGYHPQVTLEDGLRRSIEYFRSVAQRG